MNARTKVRLVLLIDGGVWGGDATFEQIHGQAATQALAVMKAILQNAVEANHITAAAVVSRPEVIEVSVTPELPIVEVKS